jgi:tripartite ATP-independent transporter DctM subunit
LNDSAKALPQTIRMNYLEKGIHLLDYVGVFSRWTNVLGLGFLFLMIAVTFIDVIMRYIFNRPFLGVIELTEVLMIVAIFMAVAHTQDQKKHIIIDVITNQLKEKSRLALEFITAFLGLGTLIILTWRMIVQIIFFTGRNQMHSQMLPIPAAPFAAVIALGCFCLTLLLLRDLLKQVVEASKLKLNWSYWLIMLGVPVVFIVLALSWMQPESWKISLPLLGFIGIVFSLVLMLAGMPIAFSLILTALLFTAHIRGPEISLNTLGTELYRNAGTYNWSVLPFFVVMGFVCFHARFGDDLYYTAYKWLGHLKGGMAIATIMACTGFAAIVGDSVAAVATMGTVAMPQMKKYNYDDRLSTGAILGGASLGPIIPPSTLFIIYGVLTSVSVGAMFIAGIIPGLILAAIFTLIIIIWCRISPNLAPTGESSTWKVRLTSLKSVGPVLILFVLVIGGIYMGAFTPTEGGAIGAMGAFFIGLAMKRWRWSNIRQALLTSGSTVSMVFLILAGALMFTRFVGWCNLSGTLTTLINESGLSAMIFVLLVLLVLFVLGMFIDTMPLILIGVPIVAPVAKAFGLDPVWFGIVYCVDINLGTLTPPVGITLFVMKGMNKEIPMSTIYRGSIPFCLGTLLCLIIIYLVPSLVTWLPGLLK